MQRGSNKSHCVAKSLWKSLWTCRKTDYRMNEWMNVILVICLRDTVLYGHLSLQNMKESKVK